MAASSSARTWSIHITAWCFKERSGVWLYQASHTEYDVYIIAVKSAALALVVGAIDGTRRRKLKEKEYDESKD
jgi:hypothetical protein